MFGLTVKTKKTIRISAWIAAILALAGCTSIVSTVGSTGYKTAVDKRSVRTLVADKEIETRITAAFMGDAKIKILDVSTYCYNGHVYLVGEHEDDSQKLQAITVAQNIPGVKSVTAHLVPKKADERCGIAKNITITAQVNAKLVADRKVHSTNVDVKTVQCTVVLLGIVGSVGELNRAVSCAREVKDTQGVKSYLKAAGR